MAIPATRAELLQAISDRFDRVHAAFLDVPAGAQDARTMEGHVKGSAMSPSDLAAYLIGWNELVLKWLARDDAGLPVDFPDTGHAWNRLGELAQRFYADYGDLDYQQKLTRLAGAKRRIVEEVAQRSENELYGAPWYGKWTKGRMIQLNTASPYENARARLRRWIKAHP